MPLGRNGNVCMQIIPTVLEKNFRMAEERVKRVKDISSWIQVDVIDGAYNFDKSFELELINKFDIITDNLLWDIHLMVREPINWIEKCIFIGASRLIGQVEMMEDRQKFVEKVKLDGLEAGLGFDIETEIDNIPKETDVVLLMGRKAGFEMAEFDEKVINKIKKVKEMGFRVGIDGGVNLKNIGLLEKEGVGIIYSGNSYFDLINAK